MLGRDAGERTIEIAPLLLTELKLHKAKAESSDPTDFVFPTRNGTAMSRSNVTRSVLKPAVERANKEREKKGLLSLVGITNHSLRRTFMSLLYEAGHSPGYVMDQAGDASAAMALEVYAKVMARGKERRPHLTTLSRVLALILVFDPNRSPNRLPPRTTKTEMTRDSVELRGKDSNLDYLIQSWLGRPDRPRRTEANPHGYARSKTVTA